MKKVLRKKYNVKCHAFDGTEPSGFELTKDLPLINYVNKNVGPVNTKTENNFDFAFESYNNIFMKMDIEGAEFPLFNSFSEEKLKKLNNW